MIGLEGKIYTVPKSPSQGFSFFTGFWTKNHSHIHDCGNGKPQTLNFLRIRRTLWKLHMYMTKDTKSIVES